MGAQSIFSHILLLIQSLTAWEEITLSFAISSGIWKSATQNRTGRPRLIPTRIHNWFKRIAEKVKATLNLPVSSVSNRPPEHWPNLGRADFTHVTLPLGSNWSLLGQENRCLGILRDIPMSCATIQCYQTCFFGVKWFLCVSCKMCGFAKMRVLWKARNIIWLQRNSHQTAYHSITGRENTLQVAKWKRRVWYLCYLQPVTGYSVQSCSTDRDK